MGKIKFLLLAFCFLCAGAANAQTAEQYYARALAAQDKGEQLQLLTKAIEVNPRHAMAHHLRGDIYREAGNLKRALADYTQTIRLRPKDPYKYFARGLAYMDQKTYPAAIDDFTAALRLKKDDDRFYYHRAQAYLEDGKYQSALRDAARVNPTRALRADLALLRARANFGLYNYAEAAKLFRQVLAWQESNVPARYYLARMDYNNELYDEAISLLSKAINRDSAYAPALRLRALAFKETGDFEAALQDYSALIALTPDYTSYNRRGLIYEEMGAWQNAAQDFSAAIAANPKLAMAYNNRAYAYMKLKNYKKAFADFETAIKLAPALPTQHINLAGYYWTARRDKKNMYKHLDLGMKYNFKDLDSLYQESEKGWLFKNINNTVEFRSFLAKYS